MSDTNADVNGQKSRRTELPPNLDFGIGHQYA
jgi:hypothetical protein